MLGKLDAPTVATHAAAIVSKLEHSDEDVRWRAVKLLGKLDKKVLMALQLSDAAREQLGLSKRRKWFWG